jgi:hypothetical protein
VEKILKTHTDNRNVSSFMPNLEQSGNHDSGSDDTDAATDAGIDLDERSGTSGLGRVTLGTSD